MAGAFSAYVQMEGATVAANTYFRLGVGTLTPYVHGQLMYMKMEWHCPTVNYGTPNRIIIQLGNVGGLTEKIMQAYAIAFATSGADSVSDVRELDYRNGLGNGILITSNHVDVWVNAVDSLNVTVNVELVVWKP